MNRKRAFDLLIMCLWLAAAAVAASYLRDWEYQQLSIVIAMVMAIVFLVLAVKDKKPVVRALEKGREPLPSESELITEMVLLSEEDTELCVWDLYGKVSMVIGRDVKENQVEIDLSKGPYASMVDVEHAVINFSAGNWYIEDLGSENGISIKKAADGRTYRISSDTPCRLERGDCVIIGLNRLVLR